MTSVAIHPLGTSLANSLATAHATAHATSHNAAPDAVPGAAPGAGRDAMPGAAPETCCAGGTPQLLAGDEATTIAEIFKALADPTRVRLLRYLAASPDGTACACHLPDALGISQPTLSFHMKKLHHAGLVSRDKRGRWVHYTVSAEVVAIAQGFLDRSRATPAGCC